MKSDLLLLSNSRMPGMAPFEHLLDQIAGFLGQRHTVYFAPYALADQDGYTAGIRSALAPLGVSVVGLHETPDPRAAIEEAEVLFVGGGNSFRLLKAFQDLDLLDLVRVRVEGGALSYMGASAGANLACPSIRTTNDMPIVEVASLRAIGLIPFQINPHYLEPAANSAHMGETRDQRLREFLEENAVTVLGLREGAWLRRQGETLRLGGRTGARIFRRGREPQEAGEHADLSWMLNLPVYFDQRGTEG